jgi:hypothetical protein
MRAQMEAFYPAAKFAIYKDMLFRDSGKPINLPKYLMVRQSGGGGDGG